MLDSASRKKQRIEDDNFLAEQLWQAELDALLDQTLEEFEFEEPQQRRYSWFEKLYNNFKPTFKELSNSWAATSIPQHLRKILDQTLEDFMALESVENVPPPPCYPNLSNKSLAIAYDGLSTSSVATVSQAGCKRKEGFSEPVQKRYRK